MSGKAAAAERVALVVGGILIAIPGVLLLFNTEGYADGKANLTITPDLFNELHALGALFVASALVMFTGAAVSRLRGSALLVAVVAFVPQGIARILSYGLNDGQHDSYLRAGIIELVVGTVLVVLAMKRMKQQATVR